MPVELNAEALLGSVSGGASDSAPGDAPDRAPWASALALPRRTILDLIVVVVAFAAAGAACGLIWKSTWHATQGVVVDHKWRLAYESLGDDFSGTGRYVVIASIAGLVVAAVLALVFERDELVTTIGVLVGAALAAWLMYVVGHRLGPPDPRPLAEHAKNRQVFPSDLRVEGSSPYLAFPAGAVMALVVVYFGFGRRGSHAPSGR